MTPTTNQTDELNATELRSTREPVHILDVEGGTEFIYADPEDCRSKRNADDVHRVVKNGYLGEKTMRSINVELAEKEPENYNYGIGQHYGSTHGLHPRAFERNPNPNDTAQKPVYVILVDEDSDGNKTMAPTTNQTDGPKTLDYELSTIPGAIDYGWSEDGRGSIDVKLDSESGYDNLLFLHELAAEWNYAVTLQGEDNNGTVHWRLELR